MSDVRPTDNLTDELCHPPGVLGDLVTHLESTAEYSCPEFFLSAALCLLSVITGRKVEDYRGTRTNVFAVSVGPTGCGKNHARMILKGILKNTHLEGPSKFTSEAGIATALEVSPARLFQIDEIGEYLSAACSDKAPAHLRSVISGLTEAFTAANSVWSPNAYASSKNVKTINQPHIVVHGTTNADSLFDGVTAKQIANGFVGRLLVFLSPGSGYARRQNFKLSPVSKSITDFVQNWIARKSGKGNLSDASPEPDLITIASDAESRIEKHFRDISHRRIGEEPIAAAIWSRASEKTSKLALLLACSRCSNQISLEDVDWAIAVTNFLTRRLISLIDGNVASSDHERKVQRVMKIIAKNGVMSLSELCVACRWLHQKERQAIVLQLLEGGSVLDVVRFSATQPARGLAIDEASIFETSWVQVTPAMLTGKST